MMSFGTLQAGQGLSVREIARRIGRVASTVSRELRRNRAEGEKVYDSDLAQNRAEARTRRPKTPRPSRATH
jgi:IS30 family transposase